jgi:hypothetical protein
VYSKYCGTGYMKNATRMKKHLVSCSKTSGYIKVKTSTQLSSPSEAVSEPSGSANIEVSALEGEVTPCTNTSLSTAVVLYLKTGKLSTLKRTSDRYLDSIYQTENRQLDELLARTVYSLGSPLSLVENADWITFIEKVGPSCKLPSRSTLRNKLL